MHVSLPINVLLLLLLFLLLIETVTSSLLPSKPPNIMVLSVSAFPESSPGDAKLITRLFGANKPVMDDSQPRRPLPSPSSSPTPVRPTISYKRPRTSSQGFGSGSFFFLSFFFSSTRFFHVFISKVHRRRRRVLPFLFHGLQDL